MGKNQSKRKTHGKGRGKKNRKYRKQYQIIQQEQNQDTIRAI